MLLSLHRESSSLGQVHKKQLCAWLSEKIIANLPSVLDNFVACEYSSPYCSLFCPT